MNKLAVVGVFDRGHFVAHKLQELGMDVTYVDLSHLFLWPQTYWHGPFPLLRTTGIEGEPWGWIEKNFKIRQIVNGCTVLTNDGPLEMGGTLAAHRIENIGKNKDSLNARSWLSVLGTNGLSTIEQLPAIQKVFKNKNSELKAEKGMATLRSPAYLLGNYIGKPAYKILKGFHVEDIALTGGRKIKGLLLKKDRSEMFEVQQLVWTLTSSETLHLNESLVKVLYDTYYRESIYSWIQAELDIGSADYLPDHIVGLMDPELPWAYGNFYTLERREGSVFSLWTKIVSTHRFSREFVNECMENIVRQLNLTFAGSKVSLKTLPLEMRETSKSLGPASYQSFREGTLSKEIELSSNSIHFVSSETSGGNTWHSILENEAEVASKLGNWWKTEQAAQMKKQKRAKIHEAEK